MVNPFEQTPAEKEECVLDMLQRGYGWNQIMKECHVSPNTISSIKRKYSGFTEDDSSKSATKISKETQALKLFGEGRTLFQVATELDIPTDSVFVFYQNYLRLRNMGTFISSYEHVKGNIIPYLQLFHLMNNLGLTPEQVQEQVKYGYDLINLGSRYSTLSNDILTMESQKQCLHLRLNFMRNQLEQFKGAFEFYQNECKNKENELLTLCSEIYTKKNLIQNFDNDEGFIRIKEVAKRETSLVMQNNTVSSAVTLSAALEAIRRYPDNQTLIFDIVTSQNQATLYENSSMEQHTPQLLQLMQNVQNEIAEQIAMKAMSSLKSMPCNSRRI